MRHNVKVDTPSFNYSEKKSFFIFELFSTIFLKKFSERQILWSLCSVVFLASTLKLPFQTLFLWRLNVPVCPRSGEKCGQFRKTSTTLPSQLNEGRGGEWGAGGHS